MDKIIIGQPYGGLGDNLQFSTIPERCHELGIKCYVSNANAYRNEGIKKLVWDLNPYVEYIDEPYNVGEYVPATGNIISDWEIKLLGTSTNLNTYPKLYYSPKEKQELFERVVIDPNAVASPTDFSKVIDKYREYNPIIINPEEGKYDLTNCEVYITKDILEWVDVICSPRQLICQFSGPSVVRAAYKKPCEVYMPSHQMNTNLFKFDLHGYFAI